MEPHQICFQFASALGLISLTCCNNCTEQHNPLPEQEMFKRERDIGNAQLPNLNKHGTLSVVKKSDSDAGNMMVSNSNPGEKNTNNYAPPVTDLMAQKMDQPPL